MFKYLPFLLCICLVVGCEKGTYDREPTEEEKILKSNQEREYFKCVCNCSDGHSRQSSDCIFADPSVDPNAVQYGYSSEEVCARYCPGDCSFNDGLESYEIINTPQDSCSYAQCFCGCKIDFITESHYLLDNCSDTREVLLDCKSECLDKCQDEHNSDDYYFLRVRCNPETGFPDGVDAGVGY